MKTLRAWKLLLALPLTAACGGTQCPDTNVDLSVCARTAGPFSLAIDNPLFPLPVGRKLVLEGGSERVEITVLNETEDVGGVMTRVVEEREFENNRIVEISRNFFAQAPDGTVCYFGEDVEGGDDDWRADAGQNRPGIIMPARPAQGQVYSQEGAPGVAEDQAEIVQVGGSANTPFGNFTGVHEHRDCNPLADGATDTKIYAPGVGLIVDEAIRLVRQEGP